METSSRGLHVGPDDRLPAIAPPPSSSPPHHHAEHAHDGSSGSSSEHDGDADGDADAERSSATSLTPDQEVLNAPSRTPDGKPDRLPLSVPLHPIEADNLVRTSSQRSNRQARTPQPAKRGSLSYVSHSPLPSRPPSLAISTSGFQLDLGPLSSSSDHPSYMLGTTRLSRSPSASSAASVPGRVSRSPSLRYHRGGRGETTPEDRTSTTAPTSGRTPTGRESFLLSPSSHSAASGSTLVSRSHDLLSEIAAHERYLLDLREGASGTAHMLDLTSNLLFYFSAEVRRQEQELNIMREQWQTSVSSTLASDLSVQSRTPSPDPAKATGASEPARQATEALKNWGDKINSLFVPKSDGGMSGVSSIKKDEVGVSVVKASNHTNAAVSETSSVLGQSSGGLKVLLTEPSELHGHQRNSSSIPSQSGKPSAATWWTKSWMNRGAHAPKSSVSALASQHHGPRVQNGIVIDDVENGQPTRIFLEELAEEDEHEPVAREDDESTATTPTAPTATRPVAVV